MIKYLLGKATTGKFFCVFLFLIIGFGIAFAKSDYKNPVESQIVAELIIQPTSDKYNTVKRKLFIASDKYDNHFISINVNYFKNKGKDDLQIKVNGSEYSIKLGKSIKVKAYSFYPEIPSYNVTTTVTTIGNYTTAHTTIAKQKYDYFEFYSIYPISAELYELIKEVGIEEIAIKGIYSIYFEL